MSSWLLANALSCTLLMMLSSLILDCDSRITARIEAISASKCFLDSLCSATLPFNTASCTLFATVRSFTRDWASARAALRLLISISWARLVAMRPSSFELFKMVSFKWMVSIRSLILLFASASLLFRSTISYSYFFAASPFSASFAPACLATIDWIFISASCSFPRRRMSSISYCFLISRSSFSSTSWLPAKPLALSSFCFNTSWASFMNIHLPCSAAERSLSSASSFCSFSHSSMLERKSFARSSLVSLRKFLSSVIKTGFNSCTATPTPPAVSKLCNRSLAKVNSSSKSWWWKTWSLFSFSSRCFSFFRRKFSSSDSANFWFNWSILLKDSSQVARSSSSCSQSCRAAMSSFSVFTNFA